LRRGGGAAAMFGNARKALDIATTTGSMMPAMAWS
jgi:hypothetical protein